MKSRLLVVPLLFLVLSGCTSEAEKIKGDLVEKKDQLTNSAATSIEKVKTKVEQGKEAIKSAQDTMKKIDEFTK